MTRTGKIIYVQYSFPNPQNFLFFQQQGMVQILGSTHTYNFEITSDVPFAFGDTVQFDDNCLSNRTITEMTFVSSRTIPQVLHGART